MHKKEKTIRQIAKAVHLSFSEIGQIIKEEFGEEQIQPTLQQSKYTQALQLFDSDKSLIEVAVELHLTYDEVLNIYKDYLKLKKRDKLNILYQHLGDNIQPLLDLSDKLNQTGKTPEDAIIISNHLDKLDFLRFSCQQKSRELNQLKLNMQTLLGSCQERLTNQYILSKFSQIKSAIENFNNVGQQ